MENRSATKRIEWIDRAKSFCMFLVILGHCHIQESDSFITQFIYSFHMMLFFFLSGLLCKREFSYKAFEKDILYILVPYYIYGILYVLVGIIRSHIYQPGNVIVGIWSLIIGKDASIGPFWFLYALLICKLIFYLIKMLKKYNTLLYYIFVAISFSPVYFISRHQLNLPFFTDSALCGLPFFTLGNEFFPMYNRIGELKQHYQLLIAVLLLGLSAFLSYQNGFVSIADCIIGNSIFLYYINAMTAIISVTVLCLLIKKYGTFVRITSYGSIATLGFHGYFLVFFNFYFPKILGFESLSYSIFLGLIYSIITYIGCYFLIIIIDKYCPKPFGLRGQIHKQIMMG